MTFRPHRKVNLTASVPYAFNHTAKMQYLFFKVFLGTEFYIKSIAKDIGVSRAEADRYIKGYLNTYTGVAKYMDKVIAEAKENGYVTTAFGRRRYLPELSSSNGMLRAFGERVARNAPIQGTAADIIKIAMIKVSERLAREIPAARLILQVHDELIVEAPQDCADAACRILEEEMESAASLKVRLVCDAHSGKNWLEAKG